MKWKCVVIFFLDLTVYYIQELQVRDKDGSAQVKPQNTTGNIKNQKAFGGKSDTTKNIDQKDLKKNSVGFKQTTNLVKGQRSKV